MESNKVKIKWIIIQNIEFSTYYLKSECFFPFIKFMTFWVFGVVKASELSSEFGSHVDGLKNGAIRNRNAMDAFVSMKQTKHSGKKCHFEMTKTKISYLVSSMLNVFGLGLSVRILTNRASADIGSRLSSIFFRLHLSVKCQSIKIIN